MIPKKMKVWIDTASYEELLTKWRFAPSGSPWFQGEVGEYFGKMMSIRKAEVGEAEAVRVSKAVGWRT